MVEYGKMRWANKDWVSMDKIPRVYEHTKERKSEARWEKTTRKIG